MPISHVTAHYLRREPEAPAQLSLRHEALVADEHKEALLDKLKSSFLARLNRQHGSFGENEADSPKALLAPVLESFLVGKQDFTELSTGLMRRFEQGVNDAGMEINAHFLFFMENSGDHHHVFYLFIVNQNESLTISDQLDVKLSYTIDTGPSLAGIKVDIAEWQTHKHYAYLTVLCPRGKSVLAEALDNITGFSNGINKEENTKNFLDGVDAFAKSLPGGQAQECRAQVVEYCLAQEEKDELINLDELSKELDGVDSDRFVEQVRSYHPGDAEGLMVDRRSLKRYAKFSGRDKDLSITFSTYHLHARIDYDPESDTLSVKGLPKALRAQLLAHLDNA